MSPWIADVSPLIAPGAVLRVEYKGLLQGANPPAVDQPGMIMMQSAMVFYA